MKRRMLILNSGESLAAEIINNALETNASPDVIYKKVLSPPYPKLTSRERRSCHPLISRVTARASTRRPDVLYRSS